MDKMFSSGLLGGVTAAVVWMACAMLAGLGAHEIGLWALVLLVLTCLVVTFIGGLIARGAGAAHERGGKTPVRER